MRVALISMPVSTGFTDGMTIEPLGLEYVSAALTLDGHETAILDIAVHRMTRPVILRRLAQLRPDWVGFTVYAKNKDDVRSLAAEIKRRMRTRIVLGGPATVLSPELALEPAVDFVVLGDGEHAARELTRHLADGSVPLASIRGLAYARDGKLVRNKPREFNTDLDALPFPDRRFVAFSKYNTRLAYPCRPGVRQTAIITSRGCPYTCGFCVNPRIFGGRWAGRSPENVMEEIRLVRGHGIHHLNIVDEDLNVDRDRAARLYRLMAQEPDPIGWGCETAPCSLDVGLIDLMAAAGCRSVFLGIETGSPRLMKKLSKRVDLGHARALVERLHRHHIFTIGSFILGMPWEDAGSIRETIDFAKSLNLNIAAVGFHRPVRGSAFERFAVRNGLLPADYDENAEALRFTTPSHPTLHLGVEEVRRSSRRFMTEVYGRPAFVLAVGRRMLHAPSHAWAYVQLAQAVGAGILTDVLTRLPRGHSGTMSS